MDQTVGHTHGDARPAELAAALAVAPHLKKMKASIVTAVAAAGDHGRTPDEYQQQAGGLINTVRRRFTDLWKEGQLRPTDRTRPNARGNPETVWVIGRDEDAMRAAAPKTYVYLDSFITGDGPFTGSVARPGLYVAHRNPLGAVSVMLPDGKLLGVKPGEFVECGSIVR